MTMEGVDFSSSVDDFGFSPAELEVCGILLELPQLIAKSERSRGLLLRWGCRKRRSAFNSTSTSVSPSRRVTSSSLPPPPPPSRLPESAVVVPAPGETEGPSLKKVKLWSPDTPLLFSLSESDENAKRSKIKVSGKKISEWLVTIEELTKRKQSLEGELENVKRYHDRLKALNSELKAKKQEMILGLKQETTPPETASSNPTMEIAQPTVISSALVDQHHHHHHPSIDDQTAPITEQIQNFENPSGKMPVSNENIDPIGIPDLNLSLEKLTNRNYSRIMAAQARQRRIQICKIKNSHAASKLQSPNPCR